MASSPERAVCGRPRHATLRELSSQKPRVPEFKQPAGKGSRRRVALCQFDQRRPSSSRILVECYRIVLSESRRGVGHQPILGLPPKPATYAYLATPHVQVHSAPSGLLIRGQRAGHPSYRRMKEAGVTSYKCRCWTCGRLRGSFSVAPLPEGPAARPVASGVVTQSAHRRPQAPDYARNRPIAPTIH
jgi:hypothetical protein